MNFRSPNLIIGLLVAFTGLTSGLFFIIPLYEIAFRSEAFNTGLSLLSLSGLFVLLQRIVRFMSSLLFPKIWKTNQNKVITWSLAWVTLCMFLFAVLPAGDIYRLIMISVVGIFFQTFLSLSLRTLVTHKSVLSSIAYTSLSNCFWGVGLILQALVANTIIVAVSFLLGTILAYCFWKFYSKNTFIIEGKNEPIQIPLSSGMEFYSFVLIGLVIGLASSTLNSQYNLSFKTNLGFSPLEIQLAIVLYITAGTVPILFHKQLLSRIFSLYPSSLEFLAVFSKFMSIALMGVSLSTSNVLTAISSLVLFSYLDSLFSAFLYESVKKDCGSNSSQVHAWLESASVLGGGIQFLLIFLDKSNLVYVAALVFCSLIAFIQLYRPSAVRSC